MDWTQILVLALLAVVVTLYITRWLPIEVTSLLVPPILFGAGILDLKYALSGFSNSGGDDSGPESLAAGTPVREG